MKTLHIALLLLFLCLNGHSLYAQVSTRALGQEKQKSDISELKILHSGFLSRDTLIIRYRTEDKEIVEVIDKGKKVPSSQFKNYESKMMNILEMRQLNELLPAIEKVDEKMESPHISNLEKLNELEYLLQHLNHMESDLANRYREVAEVYRTSILDDYIQEIVDSPEMSDSLKLAELKELLEKTMHSDYYTQDFLSRRVKGRDEFQRRPVIERRDRDASRSRRRMVLSDVHVFRLVDEILDAIVDAPHLSESEKVAEMERIIDRIGDIESDEIGRKIAIKQFEWDVRKLLGKKGLLSPEESEFRLTIKHTKINGKKVPEDVHDEVLAIYEKYFGEPYRKGLTIVLGLVEPSN